MMNVLIVGNSDINEALKKKLREENFTVDMIPDFSGISRLQGKPGSYELATPKKKYKGCGVIVTEQPYSSKSDLPFAKALNLLNPAAVDKLIGIKGRKKAAILLDYGEETPEWLTARAYEAAIRLANAKKDVLFLSMFSKAASAGMEKLYLKARQAGVSFIKYEQASLEYDEDRGEFTICVNDGVVDTVACTPYLITTGIKDNSPLAFLSGKFRVSDKEEIASEFRFFLNPALTTRKGLYYIHNNLDAAFPYIVNELREVAKGEAIGAHAEIDAGKCAFCYSCYRACPHAALEPDIKAGAMVCTADACLACGVCVALCPGEAIALTESSLLYSEKTKEPSPCLKVFYCENSAAPAFSEITKALGKDAEKLSFSEIPCGGRLGHELITGALATCDKVLVAVCLDGACRHMNGGKRACKQAARAAGELEKMGADGVSIKCVQVSHAMPMALLETVKEFLKDS